MSGDPTAAERARRYRARRRDDITPQIGSTDAIDLLRQLVAGVDRLCAAVENPGASVTSRTPRDVTERHGDEPARAPARVGDTGPAPTGLGPGTSPMRDGVTAFEAARQHSQLLELLTRGPASVAALADAAGVSQRDCLESLIELQRLGLVHRIAGMTPRDRDRWERQPATPPAYAELELGLPV